MKKIFSIYIILCLTILSCTKDFEQINTNNNLSEEASPSLLLPAVIFSLADLTINENQVFGDVLAQYTANYEYRHDIDVFNWTADDRYWSLYPILQDAADIQKFGQDNADPNYEAIGTIIRAYGFSILTDVYGDIPYSEANKATEGIYTPVYDTQQSVYNNVLAELENANNLIDGLGSVAGDILFGGDMMKWKKFANSLRLRMLWRSAAVQDNTSAITTIVSNPDSNPLITTSADNAAYHYSGNLPDSNPQAASRGRAYDFYLGIPTTHIINQLQNNNDPRLEAWFDPIPGTTEFLGTAPGQNLGDVGRPGDFAGKDATFFDSDSKLPAIFITASEVHFILAEMAQAGIIPGDAATFYNDAISSSFEQWGVEMPADFLTATAPYDEGNETFAIQKWIGMYGSPLQTWMEWKRTSLPSFIKAGPGTINNAQVPVRLLYPALEQSVNGQNYTEAASRIGGDNINSRVWWDK